MIVTACLAWWDEPPELLADCVTSLRELCDRLIAVDGGYTLIPGAGHRSPPEQHEALIETCATAGLELTLVVPPLPWDGQVAKRDFMMKAALPRSNWLFVVDADYLIRCKPLQVRAELEATARHAVTVDFFTPEPDGDYDLDAVSAHRWHANLAGKTKKTRLIFRALPGFQVERHHWWYSALVKPAKNQKAERVGLWGGKGVYPPVDEHVLQAPLVIEHRCLLRDEMRIGRNRAYCSDRERIVARVGAEP